MGERWRDLGVVEMESRKVGKREVESIFEKVYGKNVGGRVAKEEGGGGSANIEPPSININ